MEVDGDLSNAELSAPPKSNMQNPVVLIATAIPVEVNVGAINRDIVDVQSGILG